MYSEGTRAATVLHEPSLGTLLRRTFIMIVSALPAPAGRAVFWLLAFWHEGTRAVITHPGTWRALEPFYTLPRRRGSIWEEFWGWALDNARALPERLDIVVSEITSEARLRRLQTAQPVRILSIGAGSARPVLEAAAAVDPDTELMLLDIDSTALEFSQTLAAELNVRQTTRCVANILRLGGSAEQELRDFRPDVVELVGLLDYLNDRLAALMLNRIARFMPAGSALLVGNIIPNRESRFFDKALKWPQMVYREPEDFVRLVESCGFAVERTRHDPYGLHTVVKARRLAGAAPVPAREIAAPRRETAAAAARPYAKGATLLMVAIGTVIFGAAAIAGIAAPKQQASLNPPHPVFQTQATVDALFPPQAHVVPIQVLAQDGHGGNVLQQPVLAELLARSEALRSHPEIAPYLLSETSLGTERSGFFSIPDALEEILATRGTSLAGATTTEFNAALTALFSGDSAQLFRAALSQHAEHVNGEWHSPALYFYVQADNDHLGGGVFQRNIGGDAVTLEKERFNRSVQAALRGESYVATGIVIDLNLQANEQGYSLSVLARIVALIMVLGALGGLLLRSWRSGVLIIAGSALVFVWVRGIAHLLGDFVSPSLTTEVILPIALLAFGVDFALHVIHKMRGEAGGSARTAVRLLWATFLLVAITDAIAFLSNMASPVEAVRSFAIMGALGILAAFILMGICVPLILESWERYRPVRRDGGLSLLTRWAGAIAGSRKGRNAVVALVLLYVPATLMLAVNIDRGWDVKDFFIPSSDLVAGLEERDYHFGDARGEEVTVLLRGDSLSTPQGALLVAGIREALGSNPFLAHDPVTGALVEARGLFPVLAHEGTYVTQLVVEALNTRELANITAARESLDDTLGPFAVDYELTGAPLEREAALNEVTTSLVTTLLVAAGAILAVLTIAFRSFRHAAIALAPVVLVVLGTFAFMRVAGYNLNFVTATVGVIAVGVGIDYPLYLVCRFRARLALGRSEAVRRSLGEAGWTIAAAAVTSCAGFAILATSPMPLFVTYGVLATVMIGLAALWSLLLVPALLEQWG